MIAQATVLAVVSKSAKLKLKRHLMILASENGKDPFLPSSATLTSARSQKGMRS